MKIIIITMFNVYTITREGVNRYVLKSLNTNKVTFLTLHNVLQGMNFYRRHSSAKIIFAK